MLLRQRHEPRLPTGTSLLPASDGLRSDATSSGSSCKIVNNTTAETIHPGRQWGLHTDYESNPTLIGAVTLAWLQSKGRLDAPGAADLEQPLEPSPRAVELV